LAGKSLPPPARGWRRESAEAVAIAIASDLAVGHVDTMAWEFQQQAQLLQAPLESALVSLYAAGRSRSDDVVVSRTEHGMLLGEAAGSLPIAWLSEGASLAPVLDQLGRPPTCEAALFAPLAAELADRRAFPHLDLTDLERHLGAAVGTALGSLAQDLWGIEHSDAPMLALDRLADLEIEVRLDSPLAVAIPRGQRWLDLKRIGLLDHWSIPWAPGGHWELVTW
jgi:hypothetical protein